MVYGRFGIAVYIKKSSLLYVANRVLSSHCIYEVSIHRRCLTHNFWLSTLNQKIRVKFAAHVTENQASTHCEVGWSYHRVQTVAERNLSSYEWLHISAEFVKSRRAAHAWPRFILQLDMYASSVLCSYTCCKVFAVNGAGCRLGEAGRCGRRDVLWWNSRCR